MKEFKPTWLYVKQHNKTGLKYFGKTILKDPIKYKGSGTRWTSHIKKHGNDVTTIWCQLFTDKDSLMEYSLKFSVENNIVESTEWANLIPENGINGNISGCVTWNKGVPHSLETKKKMSESNAKSMLGKKHSESAKKKMSDARKGKSPSNKGKARSDEQKLAQSLKMKGRTALNKGVPAKLATCEFCGKISTVGAIGRYHKSCGK